MNISGVGIFTSNSIFNNYETKISGISKDAHHEKTQKDEDQSAKRPEEKMIEEFKETHDPTSQKVGDIMAKFIGGKELTPEELEFLAKNAPESYQTVKEVMMERQQMEMEMEAARSQLEVSQAHSGSISMVKATKGTGETELANAPKTMMRLHQLGNAYGGFVGSVQYRELEDEEDKAKKILESLEELEEKTEPIERTQPKEKMESEAESSEIIVSVEEKSETDSMAPEEDLSVDENQLNEDIPQTEGSLQTEDSPKMKDSLQTEDSPQNKDTMLKEEPPFLQAQLNITHSETADITLREKVNNLYRKNMRN